MKGRERLTPEKSGQVAQHTRAWVGYWSTHPREKVKHETRAKARDERARIRRMAKHQPVVTDIESDGEYLSVAYTRNNGERVIEVFKATGG